MSPVAGAAQAAITCPAGEGVDHTMRGPACRCRIAQETITRDENASSLKAFCAGRYTDCPVWRRYRKAEHLGHGEAEKLLDEMKRTAPSGRPT